MWITCSLSVDGLRVESEHILWGSHVVRGLYLWLMSLACGLYIICKWTDCWVSLQHKAKAKWNTDSVDHSVKPMERMWILSGLLVLHLCAAATPWWSPAVTKTCVYSMWIASLVVRTPRWSLAASATTLLLPLTLIAFSTPPLLALFVECGKIAARQRRRRRWLIRPPVDSELQLEIK